MSRKPQKTFVSKDRYIHVMGWKLSLFTIGACSIVGGAIAALAVMNEMVISLVYPHETQYTLLDCTAFAVGAGLLLMCGAVLYRKSHKIASVKLTTPQNAHLLPMQDTLGRAADLPPTQPQTELLRAAQSSYETSPEELLRVVKESRTDV